MKATSLDALIDRHIGKVGTKRRDEFENELRLDIIGETIKRAGKELRMPNAWAGLYRSHFCILQKMRYTIEAV